MWYFCAKTEIQGDLEFVVRLKIVLFYLIKLSNVQEGYLFLNPYFLRS